MKKLLVTDTHLGLYKSSDFWHNIVLDLFREIHDFCLRENVQTLIHLGDFFHDRKALNTKTQSVAHEIIRMFDRIKMYIIVGNHDTFYKTSIHPTSLEFLRKYDNVVIVDKETMVEELVLCPWSVLPSTYKSGYLCGHFEIKGFFMNNSYICDSGTDPSVLENFEHVYSGHFHTPSNQGNITYLGSAYPQTFHDVDSVRGYYLFDDGDLQFLTYDSAPKFIKCNTENYEEAEIEGNVVKLQFLEDYGNVENQKIVDEVNDRNPAQLHVDFQGITIVEDDEEIVDSEISMLNHEEIIDKFINDKLSVPKGIKKKLLKSLMRGLINE